MFGRRVGQFQFRDAIASNSANSYTHNNVTQGRQAVQTGKKNTLASWSIHNPKPPNPQTPQPPKPTQYFDPEENQGET